MNSISYFPFNSGSDPADLFSPPGVHRPIRSSKLSMSPLIVWTAFKFISLAWLESGCFFLVLFSSVVACCIKSGWQATKNGRITFFSDLDGDEENDEKGR